jgi:hypothetical protein
MINIKVDESEVRKLCLQKIGDLIKEVDAELIFWDSAELKKRTYRKPSSSIRGSLNEKWVRNGISQFVRQDLF